MDENGVPHTTDRSKLTMQDCRRRHITIALCSRCENTGNGHAALCRSISSMGHEMQYRICPIEAHTNRKTGDLDNVGHPGEAKIV